MNFICVRDNKSVYGDGVHDDTKALQECIDNVKEGGTVYFPDGTYLLSGSLIFYSNQHLKFSDKAILLRSAKSDPITRYLLASYSEPHWRDYDGTHDVVISGATFDGNKDCTEKSTLLNTVHCKNIVIENCRFVNCSTWHFIEINSTENAVVRNCVFDGPTYTVKHSILFNELIQLDLAQDGSYGPVYDCDGKLIDFHKDDTVCSNILIENNIFKCDGSPGIGHHNSCPHHSIVIRNNVFEGPSGRDGKSRGYIMFRPAVYDVTVEKNVFIAPENDYGSPNLGIIIENTDTDTLKEIDNIYTGNFTEKIFRGENTYR